MSSFIFGMPRSNPFSQWSHVTMTHAIRSKQTNVSWQLKQNKYKISSCYKISSAAYHPTGMLEKTICVLFHTFHWSPVHIQCQFEAMNLRFDIFTCLIPALLTNSCPVYDPARPLCSTGTTQHWLQLTAWKFWDIVHRHTCDGWNLLFYFLSLLLTKKCVAYFHSICLYKIPWLQSLFLFRNNFTNHQILSPAFLLWIYIAVNLKTLSGTYPSVFMQSFCGVSNDPWPRSIYRLSHEVSGVTKSWCTDMDDFLFHLKLGSAHEHKF